MSSFWYGYLLGVSQNIVAAVIWGPFWIRRIKHHLHKHHESLLRRLGIHDDNEPGS